MKRKKEPEQLRWGKRFHKLIQKEWLATAEGGRISPEKYLKKINGKRGRVDILVEELADGMVSVVEVKGTNWDRIKSQNLLRNIRGQINQVWDYVDSQLDIYGREVCPGVIFPKMPKTAKRLLLIEKMFNDSGIQVVWHNESTENLKVRMAQCKPVMKVENTGKRETVG